MSNIKYADVMKRLSQKVGFDVTERQPAQLTSLRDFYSDLQAHNNNLLKIVYEQDSVCPECNGLGCVQKGFAWYDCPARDCYAAQQLRINRRQRIHDHMVSITNRRDQQLRFTFNTYERGATNDYREIALGVAREYVDSLAIELGGVTKRALMFTGRTGTGKTSLASAIVNELELRDIHAEFFRVEDIIAAVQSTYNPNHDMSSDQMIRFFAEMPVLAMDEWDMFGLSEDKRRIIESIIDYRSRGETLPTIGTTNLSQDEFIQRWGERTGDRMIHMAHWIRIEGKIRNQNNILEPIND